MYKKNEFSFLFYVILLLNCKLVKVTHRLVCVKETFSFFFFQGIFTHLLIYAYINGQQNTADLFAYFLFYIRGGFSFSFLFKKNNNALSKM